MSKKSVTMSENEIMEMAKNEESWPMSEINISEENYEHPYEDQETESDEEQDGNTVVKDFQDTDVEEYLIFELSEKEKANLADEATVLYRKRCQKEREFEEVKKKYKGEIADLETSINSFFEVILNGEEIKVKCVKRVHFKEEMVEFIYNGEVKKTRKMHENEKAMQLFESSEVNGNDFVNKDDALEAGINPNSPKDDSEFEAI